MSKAQGIAQSANQGQFKNRIINGAMMIDQRNAGAATTGATSSPYTLDRWKVYSGGANCTVQRVSGFNGFQNALRITGVASNNGISVFQRIESFNAFDLASQSITVSFLTNSSVASRSVDLVFQNPTTTSDDFGTQTEFARRTITVPNGIASHSVTVTASAGVIRGIQFVIELGALTSGTIDITGVQLEKGSTATSFDYRPYGTELALCQRYYAKLNNDGSGVNTALAFGRQQTTTASHIFVNLPVTMRAEPTVAYSGLNVSDFANYETAITGITSLSAGYNAATLYVSHAAVGGQNISTFLQIPNNTSGFLTLTAEL